MKAFKGFLMWGTVTGVLCLVHPGWGLLFNGWLICNWQMIKTFAEKA